TSSVVFMGATALEKNKVIPMGQGWRYMFLVGAAPALMVVLTAKFLREPEPWLRLKEQGLLPKGGIFSPYTRLFQSRRWRRNLIIGALIASTGVVGLWAIGEYAVDLQTNIFGSYYAAKGLSPDKVATSVKDAKALAFLLNQIGAAIGMWLFTRVALAYGRRLAFFVGFSAALVTTVLVYWRMSTPI